MDLFTLIAAGIIAAIAGVVALAGGTLDPTAMPLAEANLDEPVLERNQFTRSWLRPRRHDSIVPPQARTV